MQGIGKAWGRTSVVVSIATILMVVSSEAFAEKEGANTLGATEYGDFLGNDRGKVDQAAERLREATPEMREARREMLAMRLARASRWERRRILRHEGRVMRALPKKDRKMIEAENRAYREKHGLLSGRDRRNLAESGDFDFSRKERRVLRRRFTQLSKEERRELIDKIRNVRDLPEGERELLHERLDEMKSFTEDEEKDFRVRAKRWRGMSNEKKEKLRRQMQKLRAMPAEERMELLDKVMEEAGDGGE